MLSDRLRMLRKKTGRSQEEVAKGLGLSRSRYSHYETGRNQPDNEMLAKIANYFDVTVDYLVGNDVPEWATKEDVLDLQEMLESNVNMSYGGENLTEEEKQRVREILTAIFWEKARKGDS